MQLKETCISLGLKIFRSIGKTSKVISTSHANTTRNSWFYLVLDTSITQTNPNER